ncbi:hypothetical protein BT93_F1921 [Corymbia citriodora subsp. variegata]|nr:hypothetical protein BT93_F1921 [Corymbia citriodora subsp. variegata]
MVLFCNSMEKIIGDGIAREELAASRLFSCLECLHIEFLPKLRSICDHTLLFPQGVEFFIWRCPDLRKLPLDSNNARGSFSIFANKDWWVEFEWDPAAPVTFQRFGSVEKMTFGEAACKMKDESIGLARIRFLPHN